MAGPHSPRICVVGAALMDLISYVPRLPVLGETLHGSDFRMGFGGKGANQAVMAAKLGAHVSIVTRLGRDSFGDDTVRNFESLGIDTTHVAFDDDAPTGVAPIAVDPNGDNSIIIVTGATARITPADVEHARAAIEASHVLVCQLEIPLEATLAALRVARAASTVTVLNPAPASRELDREAYGLVDVLCPNEPEAGLILDRSLAAVEESTLARELRELGPENVVLTLGERGCVIASRDGVVGLPAEEVDAVDTTGAGDAFVGTLAVGLARGDLAAAAARANRVAGLSVQRRGTQTSFPSLAEAGAQ